MLSGVIMVVIAYQSDLDNWDWQMFDNGMLAIATSIVYYSFGKHLMSFISWIFFSFVLNSWITSTFADISVFGENQKVFVALISLLIMSVGLTFFAFKFYYYVLLMKKHQECTRDAKNKYKEIKNHLNNLDKKVNLKDERIEMIKEQSMRLDEMFNKIKSLNLDGK